MERFSATIKKIGINPYVDVPEEVSRSFDKRGYIPVKGIINGFKFRQTLVPIGGGRHRLFINGEMRKGATVGVGDHVGIEIEFDPEPRVVPVPTGFAEALEKNKKAQ